jgi:hypothetical protein
MIGFWLRSWEIGARCLGNTYWPLQHCWGSSMLSLESIPTIRLCKFFGGWKGNFIGGSTGIVRNLGWRLVAIGIHRKSRVCILGKLIRWILSGIWRLKIFTGSWTRMSTKYWKKSSAQNFGSKKICPATICAVFALPVMRKRTEL